MKRQGLKSEPCSIARTLSIIGERWTVLILRECFRNVSRFDAFEAVLKIPRAVLADRLKMLVEEGVLEKQEDKDHARRYSYILTPKGLDLRPILLTMLAWGDKYQQTGLPPKVVEHLPCGHVITPVLRCPECHDEVHAGNTRVINPARRPKNAV